MRFFKPKFCHILSVVILTGASAGSSQASHYDDDDWRSKLPSPIKNEDYLQATEAQFRLGEFLFHDKILSGNKNISCSACHNAQLDTDDWLSLPIGEGGRGLGLHRTPGEGDSAVLKRSSRNAPPLFALGHKEFTRTLWDGRVEQDPSSPTGFISPIGDQFPLGIMSTIAAQVQFPVLTEVEMGGQPYENPVGLAASQFHFAGEGGAWDILVDRLREIPEYVDLFQEAWGVSKDEITYVNVANSLAAFVGTAWKANDTSFDRYLKGDRHALSRNEQQGMRLFYGKAKCVACHNGILLTKWEAHAIAMPQIGPGQNNGFDGHEDYGRENATGDPADRYKFRTPTLRNVALTGPWGHDGAYRSLEAVVRHHLDPVNSLYNYDCKNEPVLPSRPDLDATDCIVHNSDRIHDIAAANELEAIELSEQEISYLMDFLNALTDPSTNLLLNVPKRVPSGLSISN